MFCIDGGDRSCDLIFVIVGKELRNNTFELELGCVGVGSVVD